MGDKDGLAASRRRSTKQTWAAGHLALHVFPEGDPLLRGVLVHAVAVQEVHGHIQRVLHVALKAKVLVPDKGQHARPVWVHIRPDVTPPAHIPCTIGSIDMRKNRQVSQPDLDVRPRHKNSGYSALGLGSIVKGHPPNWLSIVGELYRNLTGMRTRVSAVPERRVGKQRGRHRLEGNANSHLLDHVCLALKIQIDLQQPLCL